MPGVATLSLLGLLGLSAAFRTTPGLLFLYCDPPILSVMLRLCIGENVLVGVSWRFLRAGREILVARQLDAVQAKSALSRTDSRAPSAKSCGAGLDWPSMSCAMRCAAFLMTLMAVVASGRAE